MMNERRSIGRMKIAQDALLFFGEQTGVRSCAVTDITNPGAGIRTQYLPAIPLNFELSFETISHNSRLSSYLARARLPRRSVRKLKRARGRRDLTAARSRTRTGEPIVTRAFDPTAEETLFFPRLVSG
jgi:hypothetical protein